MQELKMRFPGGKKKAFTTSYDDGVRQDKRLVEKMNRYGIKGTFNISAGFFGREGSAVIDGFATNIATFSASELKEVYQGQEIAAHGFTHMDLTSIPMELASYQIIEDRKQLEQVTGALIKGFAYPYGTYNQRVRSVLKTCGIHYARTVKATRSFGMPEDFLEWHPTCHHNDPELMLVLDRFLFEENPFLEPRLFYLWGHSYEFDQRLNWELPDILFEKLASQKEEIWMATNEEIYRYRTAYLQLEYSAEGNLIYNPTAETLWFSLDGKPHTIKAGETFRKEETNGFITN
ncbi:MAG: peptidoglycan-N-acetylglucosamine deacetylase [Clostridiales bacterium]|nr:peptidoglycan-N-acetylglucosamine deacetylase [Clostridiales bacterium]